MLVPMLVVGDLIQHHCLRVHQRNFFRLRTVAAPCLDCAFGLWQRTHGGDSAAHLSAAACALLPRNGRSQKL
eukprot:m.189241 g.189241  ORF g.189241 m.189241 type:complete len:72 (-) comp17690_c0_seq1:1701-1916(-)